MILEDFFYLNDSVILCFYVKPLISVLWRTLIFGMSLHSE